MKTLNEIFEEAIKELDSKYLTKAELHTFVGKWMKASGEEEYKRGRTIGIKEGKLLGKASEHAKVINGVSQWERLGRKYCYWDYFEKRIKQASREEALGELAEYCKSVQAVIVGEHINSLRETNPK